MTLHDLRRQLDLLTYAESARLESFHRARRDLERVLARRPDSERAREVQASLALHMARSEGRLAGLTEARQLCELVDVRRQVVAAKKAAREAKDVIHVES